MLRTLDRAGEVVIERSPISTWFGIGGGAAHYVVPSTIKEVRACIADDPGLRVLGDGANLLVDDGDLQDMVLDTRRLNEVHWDMERGVVRVQAGVNLPKLIIEAVRRGLGGIEGLAGIPASIGGATIMNAGGAFGTFGDAVARVRAINRQCEDVTLERGEIEFGYRRSGLNHLVVTEVELQLTPGDVGALRSKLKEAMAYKKGTQPMAADSAGCVFKNPVLGEGIEGIGEAGERVSAGMLIDRAGCKGLTVGGARVSDHHANFIVTTPTPTPTTATATATATVITPTPTPTSTATARDVMGLMDLVTQRVHAAFGLTLNPELVLWRNDS